MSGRIGESYPGCWSGAVRPLSPVDGKQAARLEGYLYPEREDLQLPTWMVCRVSGDTPLTEVSNTVRLANVIVSLL